MLQFHSGMITWVIDNVCSQHSLHFKKTQKGSFTTILTEAVPAWQVLISLVFLCLFAVHGADLDLLMKAAPPPPTPGGMWRVFLINAKFE